jgi:hypothetical protein
MPPPDAQPSVGRLIAQFDRALIAPASPAVNCRLKGRERGTGIALEVHFSGASGMPPDHTMNDLQVFECAEGDARGGWILSGSARFHVQARAVQVHRMPAQAFYGAVPGAPLTWARRAGWALLLNFLRIPGAVRLIRSIRSARP